MQTSLKYGLLVGIAGLPLSLLLSLVVGIMALALAPAAGIVAVFLTARTQPPPPRVVRAGAGAIAGTLLVIGQVLGMALGIWYVQGQGINLLAMAMTHVNIWLAGAVVVLLLLPLGTALGAGGGALVATPAGQPAHRPDWMLAGMLVGLMIGGTLGNPGVGLFLGMLTGIMLDAFRQRAT
jgi:hypothetical protein